MDVIKKLKRENKALAKLNGVLFNENARLNKLHSKDTRILVELFEAGGYNIPDLLIKIGKLKSMEYKDGKTEIEII